VSPARPASVLLLGRRNLAFFDPVDLFSAMLEGLIDILVVVVVKIVVLLCIMTIYVASVFIVLSFVVPWVITLKDWLTCMSFSIGLQKFLLSHVREPIQSKFEA